jgi:hypothetical protein
VTEIEVIDPTHPLFGRRFPVRTISAPERGSHQILVAYQEYMTLRIPLAATNLSAPRPCLRTKLTRDAITDLITLAEHCEAICPPNPVTSGDVCPQTCNSVSEMTSRLSSVR